MPWFMFNEPVDGYALAIFGIRTETQRNFLQESLQRVDVSPHLGRGRVGAGVLRHHQALAGIGPCGRCCPGPAQCLSPQITQGMGTATLMLDVLHNAFKNPEELVDAIIFINVTVFSAGKQPQRGTDPVGGSLQASWFLMGIFQGAGGLNTEPRIASSLCLSVYPPVRASSTPLLPHPCPLLACLSPLCRPHPSVFLSMVYTPSLNPSTCPSP